MPTQMTLLLVLQTRLSRTAALEKDLNSLSDTQSWVDPKQKTVQTSRDARSAHARSVDIVLISSMRLVHRTITPTPLRIKCKHFATETHRLSNSLQFHPDWIDSTETRKWSTLSQQLSDYNDALLSKSPGSELSHTVLGKYNWLRSITHWTQQCLRMMDAASSDSCDSGAPRQSTPSSMTAASIDLWMVLPDEQQTETQSTGSHQPASVMIIWKNE